MKSVIATLFGAPLLALMGCSSPEPDPQRPHRPPDAPRFEETACDISIPASIPRAQVRCGTLSVPEDHAKPLGKRIQLAVAVVKATGAYVAADPVVFLGGGPGAPVLDNYLARYAEADALPPLLEERDWVFFDQRGTGRSLPSLDCPEREEAYWRALELPVTSQEFADLLVEGLRKCHSRLISEGVDVSAYRSAQSARDIPLLMRALGYADWNLYGISYGTRLALTAMRDVPAHVRSVVLDSSLPLEANMSAEVARNGQRAFKLLFQRCAEDVACNQAYPNLEQTFYDVVAKLNANPATLRPRDSASGEEYTVTLTGDKLLQGIFGAFYVTANIPALPAVIAGAAKGDFTLSLLSLATAKQAAPTNMGVYFSTICAEDWPFETPELIAEAHVGVREEYIRALPIFAPNWVCPFWGARPAGAVENEPVVSHIPALVLEGEYDPITPPANGERIADSLTGSQRFHFSSFGHGVVRSVSAESARPRCAVALTKEFLRAPWFRLEGGGCVAQLEPTKFLVP